MADDLIRAGDETAGSIGAKIGLGQRTVWELLRRTVDDKANLGPGERRRRPPRHQVDASAATFLAIAAFVGETVWLEPH